MAVTMPQFRPLITGADAEGLQVWERINYKWWLQRIPMFLFAFVSSYGVGDFLHISGLPAPFYQIGSVSFDIGFLGAIALADMQLTKTTWNRIAYYALNVGMSGLAALFNVLSHAGGTYSGITPEAVTAGAPFAIVGLLFALYYESVMSGYIDKEEKIQEEQKQKDDATKVKCKFCGEGKPNMNAVYGHYKSCALRTMHNKTPGKDTCNCLQCNPK